MQIRWLFAPVVLAALAVSASAQSSDRLRVNIPFGFTVDNVSMAAGEYSVSRYAKDGAYMLSIRNDSNKHSVLVPGNAALRSGSQPDSSLVFRHAGDYYSLEDVWWSGSTSGVELVAPKTGHEPVAALSSPSTVVVIASR